MRQGFVKTGRSPRSRIRRVWPGPNDASRKSPRSGRRTGARFAPTRPVRDRFSRPSRPHPSPACPRTWRPRRGRPRSVRATPTPRRHPQRAPERFAERSCHKAGRAAGGEADEQLDRLVRVGTRLGKGSRVASRGADQSDAQGSILMAMGAWFAVANASRAAIARCPRGRFSRDAHRFPCTPWPAPTRRTGTPGRSPV